MSLASSIRRRISPRRRNAEAMPISGSLPLRDKQLMIARTVRATILPQIIWLSCPHSRLGIVAANRHLHGIEMQETDGENLSLRLSDLEDDEQTRIGEILHACVSQFLDQNIDLLREFEAIDEGFAMDEGLSARVLLNPKFKPANRPPEVVEFKAASRTTSNAAPPAGAAPASQTTADQSNETVDETTNEAAAGEGAEGMPATTAQEQLAVTLQTRLGGPLLLIWLPPSDSNDDALAIETHIYHMETTEFRPQMLGRILGKRK